MKSFLSYIGGKSLLADKIILWVRDYYGDGIFSMEDFGKLSGILRGLKGKFILSINDHPQIRLINSQISLPW